MVFTSSSYIRLYFPLVEEKASPCQSLVYVADSGSPTYAGEGWEHAVDGDTTGWDGTVTTRGPEEYYAGAAGAVFKFDCCDLALFNKIRIKTDNGVDQMQQYNRQAKTIQFWVSRDGVQFDSLTTILHASRNWASYDLPQAVNARYLKLAILTPTRANGSWRQLVEIGADYQTSNGLQKRATATAGRPQAFQLEQNYPNPFNPLTTVRYEMKTAAHVSITIFDAVGHAVRTLVDEEKNAAVHTTTFASQELPSGLYFCQMLAGGEQQVRRMLLIK